MLEILDKNKKIIGLIVAAVISIVLIKKVSYSLGRSFAGLATVGIVGAVGYLIYNEMNKQSENYSDYTTNSPITGASSNNTEKCYSNGEEVDCETLNTSAEDLSCDANDLNTEFENNSNNQKPQNVSGSFGVDQDESYKTLESKQESNKLPNECYPKDILSPEELLPTDNNSVWAQSVPAGQGSLGDQNFLNAGFHVGMNTVGQTLRNPNYQLRSEPPNPQIKVSPWLQSTIEPDTNRKPLEIGA